MIHFTLYNKCRALASHVDVLMFLHNSLHGKLHCYSRKMFFNRGSSIAWQHCGIRELYFPGSGKWNTQLGFCLRIVFCKCSRWFILSQDTWWCSTQRDHSLAFFTRSWLFVVHLGVLVFCRFSWFIGFLLSSLFRNLMNYWLFSLAHFGIYENEEWSHWFNHTVRLHPYHGDY